MAGRFAGEGCAVIANDVGRDAGEQVAAAIRNRGGRAQFVYDDVSKSADIERLQAAALEHFGRRHIVVNSAGTTHRDRPLLEVNEDEFDRIYAVNVKGIHLMAKHIVPYFRRVGGGVFVNIASTAGVRPRPGLVCYNGTKAAAIVTCKGMAAELGPDRIRLNCVDPVIGDSALLEQFMGAPDAPEHCARFLATIPLGRKSTPADVANACLFLASDEAQFIAGACLEVDGGRCV